MPLVALVSQLVDLNGFIMMCRVIDVGCLKGFQMEQVAINDLKVRSGSSQNLDSFLTF